MSLKRNIIYSLPPFIRNIILNFFENIYYPIIMVIFRFGINDGLKIINQLKSNKLIEIKTNKYKFPIKVRTNTSDRLSFIHVLVKEEYNFKYTVVPKFIIDGGANVGFTTIYYATKFPNSKIVAIEPEESNYQILKDNVKYYSNVTVLKSAIWCDDLFIRIRDIGLGKWGFIVELANESDEGAIKAVSISSLLEKFNFDEIDILKLDIEGSEKELFSINYEKWLDKINFMIVELHDRFKPDCKVTLFNAIKNYGFTLIEKGQNIILTKSNLK